MMPTPIETQQNNLSRLTQIENGTTSDAAMALFDSLPAAPREMMFGAWQGSGLQTHHPLDGLMESFGWHGKRFDGPEEVQPLVFENSGGKLFYVNPSLIPMGFVIRYATLFRNPALARLFRLFVGLLRTTKPQARLRMTEYRGIVTATMIYDALPVNDIFRKVDDHTLLGVMDLRGLSQPFFFILKREGAG